MSLRHLALVTVFLLSATQVIAAAPGNAEAGRRLVMQSCSSCHATGSPATATDGAPPLSFVAKDNRQRPAWIRGWLTDPHPPMPGIMLSRQQIEHIIAYLNILPVQ